MGSSFSIQSKDKRRRSNRLSKPPQNQATSGCSSPISPIRPAGHALSLPSTPTAWQKPWAGVSVPVRPSDIPTPVVRSQSFPSGPLPRETTSIPHGHSVAQRSVQGTPGSFLASPTSPTTAPHRQVPLYRRASFHPSKPVAFQPTTLQTNPQSPLIGQPRRSYSVHSPPQRSRNSIHRRALDGLASRNSHSRVNSQESLPIRRRSLLTRPGVATRKTTKNPAPSFLSEPSQNGIVSPNPHNAWPNITQLPFMTDEDAVFTDSEPLSQMRSPTPSDFGYTHLGALKLGSLRVVNGSASPCPSDRTRLSHTGSPGPEAIHDCPKPVAPGTAETGNCLYQMSGATSSDTLEAYATYRPIIDDISETNHVMYNSPSEIQVSTSDIPPCQGVPAKNHIPATTVNIPPPHGAGADVDFPASPFSFEKSPTSTASLRMNLRETGDEGISIHEKEKAFVPVPEKVPERHLSYSSYSSSHRKVDSGYSSATSVRSLRDGHHRASIDSHTSLQRSSGSRRFTSVGSSKDLEMCNANTNFKFGLQFPMERHLSLQGQKISPQPDLYGCKASISTMHYRPPQMHSNDRPRSASLTVAESSGRALSHPLYCAQLRSLESAASQLPSPLTQRIHAAATGMTNQSHYESYASETHSFPSHYRATHPAPMQGGGLGRDDHLTAGVVGHPAALPPGNHALHYQRHSSIRTSRAKSENNSLEQASSCAASQQYPHHSSGWSPIPGNDFLALPVSENPSEVVTPEPPRGRTRSRTIEYQRRRSPEQQPLSFTEIYA